MKLQVTGRHIQITDEIREYIEQKVQKLPRFYNRIHDVEVVLDTESEQIRTEMIVRVDRKQTFVVQDTGADVFAIVDSLVDKLERQLVKHKEKLRNHKHDGKNEVPMEE